MLVVPGMANVPSGKQPDLLIWLDNLVVDARRTATGAMSERVQMKKNTLGPVPSGR